MTKAFWMVWREGGGSPQKQHLSEGAARAEADRLARIHRGDRFHVLRAVASCRVVEVQWDVADDREEMPF
jgi:hypothetical protein